MLRLKLMSGAVLAVLSVIACGSPNGPTPQPTTLLSTTLALPAGANCNTGGNSATFSPTNGKTITIIAQGSGAVNPAITLYAPDFATQLGGAIGTGGRATLTFPITQTGNHHISVCDQTGTGGNVTVTITQPA